MNKRKFSENVETKGNTLEGWGLNERIEDKWESTWCELLAQSLHIKRCSTYADIDGRQGGEIRQAEDG